MLEVWAGLDLADIPAAIDELEHCVTDLGVRGASMVHWWADRAPHDPGRAVDGAAGSGVVRQPVPYGVRVGHAEEGVPIECLAPMVTGCTRAFLVVVDRADGVVRMREFVLVAYFGRDLHREPQVFQRVLRVAGQR